MYYFLGAILMLVVFVDKQSDYFTQCFGVDSYAEIPLFHKNLYCYMKSNVYMLLNNDYVVLSQNKSTIFGDDIVFKSIEELVDFIGIRGYKRIAFFFLNSFFTLRFDSFSSIKNAENDSVFCNENLEIFGAILNNFNAVKFLKKSTKIIPSFLKNRKEYSILKVVETGVILSNIKDYKLLNKLILSTDLCDDLPEIAQGIYSVGDIPRGDYTIIPPVYFGDNIQIESGAVIGPFSSVYDDSLIARNSVIDKSVLLNNCYISKDCLLEDCICCNNVSVRRASSIFSGSVIGADYMLSEESIIEGGAYLAEFLLENYFDLSRLVSPTENFEKYENDDGFIVLSNKKINIKYHKNFHKNPKVAIKASSFEAAEEILSDLNLK